MSLEKDITIIKGLFEDDIFKPVSPEDLKKRYQESPITEYNGYTFYRGVKSVDDLAEYLQVHGELPECESFQQLSPGDDDLAKEMDGFITLERFDREVWAEIPVTFKEAVGKG